MRVSSFPQTKAQLWLLWLLLLLGITVCLCISSSACYARPIRDRTAKPEDKTVQALWEQSKIVLFFAESLNDFKKDFEGEEVESATAVTTRTSKTRKEIMITASNVKREDGGPEESDVDPRGRVYIPLINRPVDPDQDQDQAKDQHSLLHFISAYQAWNGHPLTPVEHGNEKNQTIEHDTIYSYSVNELETPATIYPLHFQYQMVGGKYFTTTLFNTIWNYSKIPLDRSIFTQFDTYGIRTFFKESSPEIKTVSVLLDDGRLITTPLGQESDLIRSYEFDCASRLEFNSLSEAEENDYGSRKRPLKAVEMDILVIFKDRDYQSGETGKIFHQASYFKKTKDMQLERYDFGFVAEEIPDLHTEYIQVTDKKAEVTAYLTLGRCNQLMCSDPKFALLTLRPDSIEKDQRFYTPVATITFTNDDEPVGMNATQTQPEKVKDLADLASQLHFAHQGYVGDFVNFSTEQVTFGELFRLASSQPFTKMLMAKQRTSLTDQSRGAAGVDFSLPMTGISPTASASVDGRASISSFPDRDSRSGAVSPLILDETVLPPEGGGTTPAPEAEAKTEPEEALTPPCESIPTSPTAPLLSSREPLLQSDAYLMQVIPVQQLAEKAAVQLVEPFMQQKSGEIQALQKKFTELDKVFCEMRDKVEQLSITSRPPSPAPTPSPTKPWRCAIQ